MSLLSNSKIRENAEGRWLDDKSFHCGYRSLHKGYHVEWGCNYKKREFPRQEASLLCDVSTSNCLTVSQRVSN